jgi:hypothetical protein
MTEHDMENLLWQHPEKFFDEPLTRFERQPTIRVGRPDLVFTDRVGALLIVELKQGDLKRQAIAQLLDYTGHYKLHHADKKIRTMAVANRIIPERQESLRAVGFEWREIAELKFNQIAREIGMEASVEQAEPKYPYRSDEAMPIVNNATEMPFALSREFAVGPCGNVAHLPPTPTREARLNPFGQGSFLSDVFEAARSGISSAKITALATEHGNKRGIRFALENLSKGVRRNKGVHNTTGHYGLVWDVYVNGIPLRTNATFGSLGPDQVVSVDNVRRAMTDHA